ncbi:MAG: DNA alkylation repair protein, partial [Rickettsiales bacterium]|nr:DNA alkylation repair protein [Rickettsiales bacterium]
MNSIDYIERKLEESSSDDVRNGMKRFFREDIEAYGVKTSEVKNIAREVSAMLKSKSKEEIFGVCEELWHSGSIEKCNIATELSFAIRKHYTPDDFATFEHWVS